MKIFFDLDGTLIDVSKRYYFVHKKAALVIGKKSLSFKEYWQKKRKKIPENKILNIDSESSQFKEYQKIRINLLENLDYLSLDTPFENVFDTLVALTKKHKLYLITLRRNEKNLNTQLKQLKLNKFFIKIFSSPPDKDLTITKIKIIKNLGYSKNDLIIGDTEADTEAAKKLGIRSVAVFSGIRTESFLKKYHPDILIKDVSHLLKIHL
ncbi:MAG: HAD family hydrolase [Candidatus Daviesbacteria bacterium]|nr:HAD family hydrolase [Candidatus Daviesbacteria bacterium]